MKSRPRFELGSPCQFPTMVIITQLAQQVIRSPENQDRSSIFTDSLIFLALYQTNLSQVNIYLLNIFPDQNFKINTYICVHLENSLYRPITDIHKNACVCQWVAIYATDLSILKSPREEGRSMLFRFILQITNSLHLIWPSLLPHLYEMLME